MKHLLILLIVFTISCNKSNCKEITNDKFVLVGLRVDNNSSFWMENTRTKKIHMFGNTEGRYIPIINLGDTISLSVCKETEHIYFNVKKFIKEPQDQSTRFVTLYGYYYILK